LRRLFFADRFSGAVVHLTTDGGPAKDRLQDAPSYESTAVLLLICDHKTKSQKTKCPRQKLTQAFWL